MVAALRPGGMVPSGDGTEGGLHGNALFGARLDGFRRAWRP